MNAYGIEGLCLNIGDHTEVATSPDGPLGVRITNAIWVEPPRWLLVGEESRDGANLLRDLADQLNLLAERLAKTVA